MGKAKDVDIAAKAARKAFEEGPWRRMGAMERMQIMNKIADLIEKNADELAVLECLDNGKPPGMAHMDIGFCSQVMRYYATAQLHSHGEVIPHSGHFLTYTREEPVGVCAQIIPWNFPILMACAKLAPMLASGSTSILKPAE